MRGSAAGGVYASAHDLRDFLLIYRAGRLGVHPDARREIIARGSPRSNGIVTEDLPDGYDLIVLEKIDPPAADAILTPVMSSLGAAGPREGHRIAAGAPARPIGGAAPKLPATAAGRIADHYLRAYNSGDPATMTRFFDTDAVPDTTSPPAVRVDRYRSIYSDNGTLTVTSFSDATPTSIAITVSNVRGESMWMTFDVVPSVPNRLTSLQLNITR